MVLRKRPLALGLLCQHKPATTASTIYSNIKSALRPKKTLKETTVRTGNSMSCSSWSANNSTQMLLIDTGRDSVFQHAPACEVLLSQRSINVFFSSLPNQSYSQVGLIFSQGPCCPPALLAKLLKMRSSPPWENLDSLPQVSLHLTQRIPAGQWEWIETTHWAKSVGAQHPQELGR